MRTARNLRRAGYTLVELVIVTVIIVIAAAITVPVIYTMLADTRQTAAADLVQSQLAETRARAMEEGRPWQLGYLPGTGIYQLAPEDSSEWEQGGEEPTYKADLLRDKLPDDIFFGKSHDELRNMDPGTGGMGTGKWEVIAVYLPAGNARDDTTTYFGPAGVSPMRVNVRALTGGIEMQQVLSGRAE